ncbi:MAG: hypothetical protein JWQ63_2512 [Mucilaginibacter sp.]|nr:hypothetical protein [Mucilaginibacter sp.]
MDDIVIENEEPKKDIVYFITKYIPLISVLALGYSLINATTFYSYYHIDIFAYAELNEIIIIAFQDFIYIVLPSVFVFLIIVYGIYRFVKYKKQKEAYSTTSNLNKFEPFIKWLAFGFFILMSCTITVQYLKGSFYDIYDIYFEISSLVSIISVFLFVNFIEKYYANSSKNKTYILFFILFSFLLIELSICSGLFKICETNEQHPIFMNFKFGKELIFSSDTSYYIGRTRGYIFYYNIKYKTSTIYPIKDVSIITIYKPEYKPEVVPH